VTRALSIRQPHAEAILRGVKRIEYRNRLTHIRGRIFIYAALGRYTAEDEAAMIAGYRIKNCVCDELPRGVLVGTVELCDCTGQGEDFHWHVRNPERAKRPRKPTTRPQPAWFFPFGREKIR
jgi:ASCH domain